MADWLIRAWQGTIGPTVGFITSPVGNILRPLGSAAVTIGQGFADALKGRGGNIGYALGGPIGSLATDEGRQRIAEGARELGQAYRDIDPATKELALKYVGESARRLLTAPPPELVSAIAAAGVAAGLPHAAIAAGGTALLGYLARQFPELTDAEVKRLTDAIASSKTIKGQEQDIKRTNGPPREKTAAEILEEQDKMLGLDDLDQFDSENDYLEVYDEDTEFVIADGNPSGAGSLFG
jgi:hypothetical protein